MEDLEDISSEEEEELSEEMSSDEISGSESGDITKFKNDGKIKKESKIMLNKLKSLMSETV